MFRMCARTENVRLHGALCSIPIYLICNMTTFKKKIFWTFNSPQGLMVCVRTEYVPLIWYASWPCSEKMNFDLLTPIPKGRGGGVYKQSICWGPHGRLAFSSSYFYVWAKCCNPRKINALINYWHVAACAIPFNWICNIMKFRKKKWMLTSAPPRVSDPALRTKIPFDMFYI